MVETQQDREVSEPPSLSEMLTINFDNKIGESNAKVYRMDYTAPG